MKELINMNQFQAVAGFENQATRLPDFEDVLRTGARVGQDFQPACIRTNHEAMWLVLDY